METLIQQIADRLGIAADATGEWLSTALPQYAQMKFAVSVAGMAIGLALLAGGIVTGLLVYRSTSRKIQAEREDGRIAYLPSWDKHSIASIIMILAVISSLMGLIVAILSVPDVVSWGIAPDGALLDSLVKSLK